MNTQDRAVVKALLQTMTDRYLTCSEEFRAAIKHFNATTTKGMQKHSPSTAELLGVKCNYLVDVFSPDTIDANPHGVRVEFATAEEAEAFEATQRATGDVQISEDPANARVLIARAIYTGANSFGGVIGEHEELVETLRNAGYLTAAHKVDAVYETLRGGNHQELRAAWLAALRGVSAAL